MIFSCSTSDRKSKAQLYFKSTEDAFKLIEMLGSKGGPASLRKTQKTYFSNVDDF